MPLWRCLNALCSNPAGRLGHDFTADAGVCPQCGADVGDAATGRYVVRLAIIHYDPPHGKIAGLGKGHPLCDPSRHVSQLHLSLQTRRVLEQASGDPTAVNCPACIEHAEFPREAVDLRQQVPDWRVGREMQADKK